MAEYKSPYFIGGVPCKEDFRVMPGAGIAKTMADVKRLCENPDIQIIVFGAVTPLKRETNPGTIFYNNPAKTFTINSIGMGNEGSIAYYTLLPTIVHHVHSVGKKIVINIATVGSIQDYIGLIDLCIRCKVDGIEINFGCPNVWVGGEQHTITSFDPELMHKILVLIQNTFGLTLSIPIWIKLSPLIKDNTKLRTIRVGDPTPLVVDLDMELITKVAQVINQFSFIKAVVSTNTIGNVCVLSEDGKPVLGPNQANPDLKGGLAGHAIHKTSVLQTMMLRGLLNDEIEIIGAGGVSTGKDMLDFMSVGASAVQATSVYWISGDVGCWSQIGAGYYELRPQR